MDKITLENDNARDVRFSGEKIAAVSSISSSGPSNTRWTELDLYRSAGGKIICHEIGRTRWDGESDRCAVHICNDDAALVEALGMGWLAKELYDEADIDHAEDVE